MSEGVEWYAREDTFIRSVYFDPWGYALHGRKNENGEQEYAIVDMSGHAVGLMLLFRGEIVEENL